MLSLLAELIAALRDAHTERAAERAVATALARFFPVTRVALGDPADAIVPGLAIVAPELPAYFAEPAFRAVLAEVIASAERHRAVVRRVAERSRLAHAELRAERARPAIVARSAAMRAVVDRVAMVARHATTVLITGESGSGKDLVAQQIHRLSSRARGPFVALNCAAIPDALAEAELFGHERGAFTGAERARPGVFEQAHGGTLLLDEIGELSPAVQAKLLRVLQERAIRRVGGAGDIAIDVRVIAATHRPLRALVDAGRFREDLYYRLDVFAIAVPPLRERRADLGPLAAVLIDAIAARIGLPPPPLTRVALARLAAHDWPGNVRELANVLEMAIVLGGGETLQLPAFGPARAPAAERPIDDAVRATITEALRATRGRLYGRHGAAVRLGLPATTLQSKMRKLGIRRGDFVA